MELVQHLVKTLGVEEEQARGGAGLIMQLAKEKLDDQEFAQVSQALPGIDTLIPASPAKQSGGLMGALGNLTGGMSSGGGVVSNVSNMATLAAGFSKLGMDPTMISKFMPTILSFAQTKAGGQVVGLLSKVM